MARAPPRRGDTDDLERREPLPSPSSTASAGSSSTADEAKPGWRPQRPTLGLCLHLSLLVLNVAIFLLHRPAGVAGVDHVSLHASLPSPLPHPTAALRWRRNLDSESDEECSCKPSGDRREGAADPARQPDGDASARGAISADPPRAVGASPNAAWFPRLLSEEADEGEAEGEGGTEVVAGPDVNVAWGILAFVIVGSLTIGVCMCCFLGGWWRASKKLCGCGDF
jgi:hypothetical protein